MLTRQIRTASIVLALVLTATTAAADETPAPVGIAADDQMKTPEQIAEALGIQAAPLSLVDALRTALKTNPALQVAVVEVDIAQSSVLQARGLDDWLLMAGAQYTRRRTDPVSDSPFQNLGSDTLRGDVQILKPLSTGGTLGLKFDLPFARNKFRIEAGGVAQESTSDEWEPAVTLSLTHPLLAGRGSAVARANQRRARATLTTAELRRQTEAVIELQKVIDAYWELAFSYRDLEIRQGSLELAREQLRVVQAQVEVGRLPKVDALAVEQAIAGGEELVLAGEIALADRSLTTRETLGLPISASEIYIAAVDLPDASGDPVDLQKTLARALENNPGLRILKSGTKLEEIDLEVAQNALLPSLDLSAVAGPLGRSDKLGDAFERLVKFETFSLVVGVDLTVPIGNHAAKGQVAAAKARMRKTKLDVADAERVLIAQTVRLANTLRASRKRLDVTKRGVELARENLSAERARYDVGRATLFDVLARQESLRNAAVREVRARVDYLKARSMVDYVTGDLLANYGLELR